MFPEKFALTDIFLDKLEKDAPKGTRTPVLALRGPRPRPLDNGGGQFRIVACAFWVVK